MRAAAFRSASAEDRSALLDLWVAAWSAAMPSIDFEARRPWYSARWDDLHRAGATTILAWAPDDLKPSTQIVGFVTINPATHDLDQLVVRPNHQGLGIATRLIAEAKRLSPHRLELQVNQDNPRALRLYRRQGFAIVGSGVNARSGLPVWHMEWVSGPAQSRSPSG